MVEQEVIAVGEVDPALEAAAQQVPRDVPFQGGVVGADTEQLLLVRERATRPDRLADKEGRHVVVEPLVEVVPGDHHQHVGPRCGEPRAQFREMGH